MRVARRNAVLLTVLALILCVVQTFIWVHSTAPDHSETQKMNAEEHTAPPELPGVAAFCLLVAAGIVASTAQPPFGE